jgi:HAD superfamily hydrolase (TIGR01509 family)
MVIQGFFFDLDGTLVNTYEADYSAYRDAVLEVTGHKMQQDVFVALHGMEIGAKLAKLYPALNTEQIQQIRQSKKQHYAKYLHTTKANDALVRLLAQLAKHQCCVLVTTAKQDNAAHVLRQHNLQQYFTEIVCGDDVAQHKPHPEAYLLALERTGLEPGQAIAFEDSESGIQSAEAAGIAVVHIKEFLQV